MTDTLTNAFPKPENGETIFDQGEITMSSYKKDIWLGLIICIVGFGFILSLMFGFGAIWRWGSSHILYLFVPLTAGVLCFSIFAALGYLQIGQKWIVTDKAIYATNGGRYTYSDIIKIYRGPMATTHTGGRIHFPEPRDRRELYQYLKKAMETAQ